MKLGKTQISFLGGGTFGDDIWWGGGGVGQLGVRLVGAGGAMAGSQMGQGQWGKGGTDDWEGMDGRVQEGQMAVAGGDGAGGPDSRGGGAGGRWQGVRGARAVGERGGKMANKEGDSRVQKGQMAVSVGGEAEGEMAWSQMG